ncbi:MAG: SIMPL domain-containing protein [Pseudomonadota bacterium]
MRRISYTVALAAFLLFHNAIHAATIESRPPLIEVTGDAQVEIPADLAVLDFGVATQAPSAAVAARQNSERMEAVLAAVRKRLGADARITTGSYTLQTNYTSPRDGSPPKVIGYTASNIVQLKTRALTRVGETIDVAIEAGANQVQRIVFTLSDDTTARRDALRLAVARARDKTQTIASALGVKAGAVYSLIEQEVGGVRPLMRQAAAMSIESAAQTPVEPGQIEVRARVVLTTAIDR